MSDSVKTFPALSAFKEAWILKDLTKSNYSQYNEDLLLAAQQTLPEFENEVLALLLTDLEWNAMPTNDLGNGQFTPKPSIPAIPAPPVLQPGYQVADERQYDRNMAARKDIISKRQSLLLASNALKDIFNSEAILGAINSKAATGDGTLMERMADTPQAMRVRLFAHLGTPDMATYADWERIYSTPADDLDVAEWIRQESISNKALIAHQRAYNSSQRMEAFIKSYEASPGVTTCIRAYRERVPALANQKLKDLLDYVILQQPNIQQTLTRVAVGYGCEDNSITPSALAAAAVTNTTRMYSQEQLDSAIAAAVANAMQAPPAVARKAQQMYCWSHGLNTSHASADCHACRAGAFMKVRYGFNTDRCFSHQDCDHAPPCITVANAKKATKPNSFPNTPGSTKGWGQGTQQDGRK